MSEDHPLRTDEFYRRLEVAPEASRDEIVRAYRRLAHGAHPDTHPDDPDASRRFRELTEAYDVLGDQARRVSYDRAQHPIRVPLTTHPAAWVDPGGTAVLVDLGPPSAASAYLRVGPVHVEPHSAGPRQTRPSLDPAAAAMAELITGLLAAWRSW